MNLNSFDRIVSYFHALSNETFDYEDQYYQPYKQLVVSPLVFRSYKCPPNCGACCKPVKLIWEQPFGFNAKVHKLCIKNNSKKMYCYDSTNRYCDWLNLKDGRCKIHEFAPLPCKLELFKFAHYESEGIVRARVTTPGRKWALTRVDGAKGALCEMSNERDEGLIKSHISLLKTLGCWMDEFDISHDVNEVVDYLLTQNINSFPLVVYRSGF